MRWKVMVSAPYMQPVIDRFRPVFEENSIGLVLPTVEECLSEDELLQWIGDIDGVICGDDHFTKRVLDAAPRLKVISKWGTGVDSIDSAACRRRGIPVLNTPGAFNIPVSETVLGYILCFARQLINLDRDIRNSTWRKLPSTSLQECTLGIIGVGNIGKTVARRAAALSMKVLGNDVVEMPPDFAAETGIVTVSLDDLLREADFISLNCDLNPTSFHLVGDRELSLMKPEAYLINTARGPIIDEPALVRALEEGRIAGAALDVFEVEPLPEDSPLRHMDNAMLAPHNANSSPSAWELVHQNTIRNLLDALKRSSE
jgi:D-3-phosphoglycerate dehydrogenase